MCGIAGFVNWSSEPASHRLIRAMTDRLAHRGPDGEGHQVSGNAAIGHRRLSIIDVHSGAQPMGNEDGAVWVTFNGEIYNFVDLRRRLEAEGHLFRTRSDTEVIVHGYEHWGDEVVRHLRGIFAFGVLDLRRRRLFLARDRFGVKPLVYGRGQGVFAFASEMKALAVDPRLPRRIDRGALADYFEYGYVPAPATILADVRKLLPGHTIAVDLDAPSEPIQQEYWRLRYDNTATTASESDLLGRLEELLAESVRLELVSDVPLGALLSGGLDSSMVVSIMAAQVPERIKTFTIGFDEDRFSEIGYARQVAAQVGSEHFEHTVRADIASLLPRLVYHFDEPFSDASAVPTYYLCEMARRNVTVCLSGDGGDEMFGGYERYVRCLEQGRLDWIPPVQRRGLFGALATLYPGSLPGASLVAGAALSHEERFIEYMRNQYGRLSVDELLASAVRAEIPPDRRNFDFLRRSFDPGISDRLNSYLDVDVKTYLSNDILTKVDITSMMNSLEVRVPLLDHVLAEFVAGLPSTLKVRGRDGKHALKRVAEGRLPEAILRRPKMGFGVPMRQWVASELRDFTHQYLLDPSRTSGLLEASVLRTLVEDNEKRLYKSRTGGKLWWALFFEIWYQDVFSLDAPRQR